MTENDRALALLKSADEDRYVVSHLGGDPEVPERVLGYHALQAVEKSIKAVLLCHEADIRGNPNLTRLLELLNNRAGVDVPEYVDKLHVLTPFGMTSDDGSAAEGSLVPLEREWTVAVVARTLDWAGQTLSGSKDSS